MLNCQLRSTQQFLKYLNPKSRAYITSGYGAGVQLEFFVVITTKNSNGT